MVNSISLSGWWENMMEEREREDIIEKTKYMCQLNAFFFFFFLDENMKLNKFEEMEWALGLGQHFF